MINIYY